MAALSKNRDTPRLEGEIQDYGVAAATRLFAGALTCLNASGFLVPGATAATLIAVGRCEREIDNLSGESGDVKGHVRPGTFRYDNLATDPIVTADIGHDCFIVDDQTVAKTDGGGTRSRAGKVVALDHLGVWVSIGITKG